MTSDSSERLASDAAQPSVGGWDPKAASLSRACSTPPRPPHPPSLLLSPPLHSPPLPSFRGQKPNKPHLFPDSSYLDLTVVTPSSRAVLLNQIETKQVPSPGFCPAATRHLWLGQIPGQALACPEAWGQSGERRHLQRTLMITRGQVGCWPHRKCTGSLEPAGPRGSTGRGRCGTGDLGRLCTRPSAAGHLDKSEPWFPQFYMG